MNVTMIDTGSACHLAFDGPLTSESAHEMEDCIVQVLGCPGRFEIDLSRVEEIDVHGIHFLGVLDALGGGKVTVVNTSPALQRAYERLAPRLGIWLYGSREEHARSGAGAPR